MYIGEIKKEAKERFALNRYQAMLVYGVVYTLAVNIAVLTTVLYLVNRWAIWYGILLVFLFLLLLAPFNYGMTGFYVKLYRYEDINAFHIFDGFNKYNLERVIVLRLLKFALWLAFTVLLIVPGIVFAVRTSLSTYILCFDPKCKPVDALKRSNKYMKGHGGKYVGLVLSFCGWFLVGILTCGLGFIWLTPYFHTAKIVFFRREIQGDTAVYEHGAKADVADDAQAQEPQSEEDAEYARLLAELSEADAQISQAQALSRESSASEPVGAPIPEEEMPSDEGVPEFERIEETPPIEHIRQIEETPPPVHEQRIEETPPPVSPRKSSESVARTVPPHPSAVRRTAEKPPLPGTRLQVDAAGNRRETRASGETMTAQERLEKLCAERDALRAARADKDKET